MLDRAPELEEFLQHVAGRTATVGVVGLGYVGLPLALVFEQAGFPVLGFDVDVRKVESLGRGESYIRHIGAERVSAAFSRGRIAATTEFARLGECDAVILCVPTPLGPHREPDLSYIRSTAEEVGRRARPGQLIVLESTTYPGTTREEILPRLEAAGLTCGRDVFLAFSPEREDPGNPTYSTRNIPKVVGGIDGPSGEAAEALYAAAVDRVVRVATAEVAESAKILENVFRAVNIALVNELKVVFDRMGIDVWEVIEAAKTKPFGFQAFYPGPGLGGHCIPIDPYYLTWKAKEVGMPTRFIELAGEINHLMPEYVVARTAAAMNERGQAIKGAKILILGLAYKPDIDDVRESPSFELIEKLEHMGAAVDYNDPHVPQTHYMRHWGDLGKKSVPLTTQTLSNYNVVLIATNHSAYDYQMIVDGAKLVIDSRGATRNCRINKDNVVRA